jgi:hypothetical protein
MTKAQANALDAALIQQYRWLDFGILSNYTARELDYFGQFDMDFGEPLFYEVGKWNTTYSQ